MNTKKPIRVEPVETLLPTLDLSLQFGAAVPESHKKLLGKARVTRWMRMALLHPAEITVRIVGATEGRALNRDYRNKDYATNVLTFDYTKAPVVTADLVLCAPVVAKEAKEQKKTLEEHYAHLLVHGTLHAQGYDHETNETDALEMEALEVLLMKGMGYGNPYE
ncbi:rRNA maturation RNase YbeY [Hylemonella gracilis]|uniref:Endoribonuclease YbeY n=1 Tax=Hylemonella gracilis TaxID=80880 RepID=A0A4P6UHE7_9BURK|nr:rRNA maturation RNase YbeY [Hylemonella gracilis]QBK04323.1 rRNA maturation RNase YbeY [Hylemonella gracilis]